MESFADTTELIRETTNLLMGGAKFITPQSAIELINQWIVPLSESESTRSITGILHKLRAILIANPTDAEGITGQMEFLATKISLIASDIGAEGEMPSLLAALSTALRMATNDLQIE